MKVLFGPTARAQLDDCERWWKEHRPEAADRFEVELAEALDVLSRRPGSLPIALRRRNRVYRRWRMPTVQCHLYYYVDVPSDSVVIAAAWGARMGRLPPLAKTSE